MDDQALRQLQKRSSALHEAQTLALHRHTASQSQIVKSLWHEAESAHMSKIKEVWMSLPEAVRISIILIVVLAVLGYAGRLDFEAELLTRGAGQ